MKFGMGQSVVRKEDVRFLTGRGRYVDDLELPDQARAALLRSPVAHARIVSIDASAARAAPGVLAVYTGADVAGRLVDLPRAIPVENADGSEPAPVVHPHLARDRVRFVGQGVAFVVAETKAQAADAAELIEAEYEELPAVVDGEAALAEGAPQLHEAAPGNRAYAWEIGDAAETDAAFARAAHVTRVKVRNQRLVVASMETRAINVRYDAGTERWECWIGSQGAHGIRGRVAQIGRAHV